MAVTLPSLLILALLLAAAWRDLAARIIPDGLSLAVGLIGLLARLGHGMLPLLSSVAAALLLLLALLWLHGRGLLGGGDVKLATALALGLGPLAAWHLVLLTGIAGGLLGLLYVALGRLLPPPARLPRHAPLLRRVLAAEAWRIRRGGPLPYGVAIACGAVLVLLQPES